MKRLSSLLFSIGAISSVLFAGTAASAVDPDVEMNLNQTILVFNDEYYDDFSNWDVAMSTVSTIDGETAQIGYTFQPALDPGPCPEPYEDYSYCGGGVVSAALDPTTRQTYGLVGGADAPHSNVYLINPQTAEPTFEAVLVENGVPFFNIKSIFFDDQSNLYAWWHDTANSQHNIYSVDLATGELILEQSYALSEFDGNVMGFTSDETGQIWAFAADISGNSYAYTVSLDSSTVNDEFQLTGTYYFEGSFDANGYLWFVSNEDELFTVNVSAADPAATLQSRATLPENSGAFVISDVPFPVSSGVSEGEKLTAGEKIDTSILNARANSEYSVVIYSTPRELAAGTVTPLGQAQVPITIPANLEPGSHELVFTFVAPNGRTVVETYQVTVSALAATGNNISAPSIAALLLLISGAATVYFVHRKRMAS